MGGPPAWGLGEVLISPPCKTKCSETFTCGMIPLEIKQSGGKLLPHSHLWVGGGRSASRGNIAHHTKRDENRYICSLRRINQTTTEFAHFRLQTYSLSYDLHQIRVGIPPDMGPYRRALAEVPLVWKNFSTLVKMQTTVYRDSGGVDLIGIYY